MNIISGTTGYVILIDGVLHTVNKVTKTCDCAGGCLAPSYVEQYFIARKRHLCPICESETRPHRFIANANICVSDPTHYWKMVAEQNRIHWNNLANDARLIGADIHDYVRRGVLGGSYSGFSRRISGQIEAIPQVGVAQGGEVQPEMPPMPEASERASRSYLPTA